MTAMALSPPVNSTHHFCGIRCVAKWLGDKHPNAIDEFDRLQRHREWLAQKRSESSNAG